MSYSIEYGEKWIHVKFKDEVDACDVIHQTGDPKFQDELGRVRRVIYDYSQANQPKFDQQTLREFATLGKFLGELNEKVDVVSVPSDPDNLAGLQMYKEFASTDKWHVHIAKTPQEALEIMFNLSSRAG